MHQIFLNNYHVFFSPLFIPKFSDEERRNSFLNLNQNILDFFFNFLVEWIFFEKLEVFFKKVFVLKNIFIILF